MQRVQIRFSNVDDILTDEKVVQQVLDAYIRAQARMEEQVWRRAFSLPPTPAALPAEDLDAGAVDSTATIVE